MTFYNVISGILFLSACQAFLATLGTPAMWAAATLVVIILNESVLTSELIERAVNPVPYTLEMKLIDVVGFSVLAWALLILNPTQNPLNINVSASLWGANTPRWFWSLLAFYWILSFVWNQLAGQAYRKEWKPWMLAWTKVMWLPFVIAAMATWCTADFKGLTWPSVLTLLTVGAYLTSKLAARRTA